MDVPIFPPYDSYIETLLPTLTPEDLADQLPGGTPAEARDAIFVASYLNDLATDPNNATIIAAKKQDLLGWNPQAPTTLCGGLNDQPSSFKLMPRRPTITSGVVGETMLPWWMLILKFRRSMPVCLRAIQHSIGVHITGAMNPHFAPG